MAKDPLVRTSKFLSLVLRHQPETIGIQLDAHGWVAIDQLLQAMVAHGRPLTLDHLHAVVAADDKQRYAINDDGTRIRANQGHSVDVDLAYEALEPPAVLFHGTVQRFLDAILAEGLRPMSRHHVHLSTDVATATQVGSRRGEAVVLRVDAGRMFADGHEFFRSENGVWLTAEVPPEYIETGNS